MAPKVERIIENLQLGEGPHWDIKTQSLYFVNSTIINKYTPFNNQHKKADLEKHVSFIIPVEGQIDKFVVGLGRDIVLVSWDGEEDTAEGLKRITEVDSHSEEVKENQLNDAKCDTSGRLWTGTLGVDKAKGKVKSGMGSCYSFGNGILKKHFDQIDCSNGLTFSKDNKKFFYIDSYKRTVDHFDFDIKTGEISNRRILFSLEKHKIEGFPDGMTIDEDENLWVAIFDGYRVIKISSKIPETLLDTVEIPAKQVTSVAWGGENVDELYVTTAKFTENGVVLDAPVHGSIYRITGLETKGLPMSNFKL